MARTLLTTLLLITIIVLAGCTGGTGSPTETPTPDSGSDSTPTASPLPTGTPTTSPTETETSTNGTLEVHFINVGQSVSTLVIGPSGETVLIDTGDWRDDGEHVLEYLQAHDVDRIDYLVASHGDADHIGGNAAIIEHYETDGQGIGAIYDQGIASASGTYERYLDAVEEYDVTLYRTQAGDTIPLEGVQTEVLAPPAGYLANEERNENSIVLKLTYGKTSFLFTGDAEDDGEQYLVDTYGQRLQATVLKAGHHGSKSSTSGALLDIVTPQAVVISSAYDSQYDHPNEEVLERLADRSIPTYWTATHGHVVLVSDGTQVVVRTQRAAPTDASNIRAGEAIEPESQDPVTTRARIDPESGSAPATTTATVAPRDGRLEVTDVHADAEGDDRENLNDEYIVLTNAGDGALNLGGYTVTDASGASFTIPPGIVLEASDSITVRTGSGTNTASDLYWGAGRPVWNNGGDTITVTAADGTTVLQEAY